jgi:hypothetical protein
MPRRSSELRWRHRTCKLRTKIPTKCRFSTVCAPELAVTGGRGRDAYAPVMHDQNVEANMQLEKPGTILLDRYILRGRGGERIGACINLRVL